MFEKYARESKKYIIFACKRNNRMSPWIETLRPKTLSGAAAPVVVALATAYLHGSWHWTPAVLCLGFALLMQMVSNVVNDLVDGLHGRDGSDRLGPRRAFSEGQISLRGMLCLITILAVLAVACGLPLIWIGGWWTIIVGVACLLFAGLYSLCLAQWGLGDVLVLVFFGWVPVLATYYLQTGELNAPVWLLATGMGLATDVLLVVNNYRDIHQDKRNGKRTVCVALGPKGSLYLYILLGLAATVLATIALAMLDVRAFMAPAIIYLPQHIVAFTFLRRLPHTPEMNRALGHAARNILLYALVVGAALTLQ